MANLTNFVPVCLCHFDTFSNWLCFAQLAHTHKRVNRLDPPAGTLRIAENANICVSGRFFSLKSAKHAPVVHLSALWRENRRRNSQIS